MSSSIDSYQHCSASQEKVKLVGSSALTSDCITITTTAAITASAPHALSTYGTSNSEDMMMTTTTTTPTSAVIRHLPFEVDTLPTHPSTRIIRVPSSPTATAATAAAASSSSSSSSPSWFTKNRRIVFLSSALFFSVSLLLGISLLIWKLTSATSHHDQGEQEDDVSVLPTKHQVDNLPPYSVHLDIPPRYQWNENNGYCGETSMISALLYYGGYMSQYTMRDIANNHTSQSDASGQLLLGVNDYWAANAVGLQCELNNYGALSGNSFMLWVKKHIQQLHPVIIGVYENSQVFGLSGDGDPDYDHIVPVTGWGSTHVLNKEYYDTDIIYFSDNGLYTPDGINSIYNMSYILHEFQLSRHEADKSSAGVYSVNNAPTSNDPNYGIAILGIKDDNSVCLPTRVYTNVNYEKPEIVDGSDTQPASEALILTVVVTGLTAGNTYNIYQYNDVTQIPTNSFNANSGNAYQQYTIQATDTSYSMTVNILSNQIAIFRTVPSTAP